MIITDSQPKIGIFPLKHFQGVNIMVFKLFRQNNQKMGRDFAIWTKWPWKKPYEQITRVKIQKQILVSHKP